MVDLRDIIWERQVTTRIILILIRVDFNWNIINKDMKSIHKWPQLITLQDVPFACLLSYYNHVTRITSLLLYIQIESVWWLRFSVLLNYFVPTTQNMSASYLQFALSFVYEEINRKNFFLFEYCWCYNNYAL